MTFERITFTDATEELIERLADPEIAAQVVAVRAEMAQEDAEAVL